MFRRILYIILINTNLTMADEKKYDTSHLNATQKYVTLHNGTEIPFKINIGITRKREFMSTSLMVRHFFHQLTNLTLKRGGQALLKPSIVIL